MYVGEKSMLNVAHLFSSQVVSVVHVLVLAQVGRDLANLSVELRKELNIKMTSEFFIVCKEFKVIVELRRRNSKFS